MIQYSFSRLYLCFTLPLHPFSSILEAVSNITVQVVDLTWSLASWPFASPPHPPPVLLLKKRRELWLWQC